MRRISIYNHLVKGNVTTLNNSTTVINSVTDDPLIRLGSNSNGSSAYGGTFLERPGGNIVTAFSSASNAVEVFQTGNAWGTPLTSKSWVAFKCGDVVATTLSAPSLSATLANVLTLTAGYSNVAHMSTACLVASQACVAQFSTTGSSVLANAQFTGAMNSNGYATFSLPPVSPLALASGLYRLQYMYGSDESFVMPSDENSMAAFFKSQSLTLLGELPTSIPDSALTATPWRAYEYMGLLRVPATGTYWIRGGSDDASAVYINGVLTAWQYGYADGSQTPVAGSFYALEGYVPLYVQLVQALGVTDILLEWKQPGDVAYSAVPVSSLKYDPGYARPVRDPAAPCITSPHSAHFGGAVVSRNHFDITANAVDVSLLTDSLSKVMSLNGVTYRCKDRPFGERYVGIEANSVRNVLPEAVRSTRDGLAVSYGGVCGLLINAVKELQVQLANASMTPNVSSLLVESTRAGINVSWTPKSAMTSVALYASGVSVGPFLTPQSSLQIVPGVLGSSTTYTVAVSPQNALGGWGETRLTSAITPPEFTDIANVTAHPVTDADIGTLATWTPVNATFTRIYQAPYPAQTPDYTLVLSTTATSALVPGLRPSSKYSIKVEPWFNDQRGASKTTLVATQATSLLIRMNPSSNVTPSADGLGNPLTTFGSPSVTYTPARGPVLNVADGYFVSNVVVPSSFSFSAWVFAQDTASKDIIGSLNVCTDPQYNETVAQVALGYREGNVVSGQYQEYSANGTTLTGYYRAQAAANVVGKWVHIGYTYDNFSMKMFVNGSRVHTGVTDGWNGNVTMILGGSGVAPGRYFNGFLDDVRVYGTALPDEQMAYLYSPVLSSSPVVSSLAPLAWYDAETFRSTQGATQLTDLSGNGHHMTIDVAAVNLQGPTAYVDFGGYTANAAVPISMTSTTIIAFSTISSKSSRTLIGNGNVHLVSTSSNVVGYSNGAFNSSNVSLVSNSSFNMMAFQVSAQRWEYFGAVGGNIQSLGTMQPVALQPAVSQLGGGWGNVGSLMVFDKLLSVPQMTSIYNEQLPRFLGLHPTSFVVTALGPRVWLDAEQSAPKSGTWHDLSGNKYDFAVSAQAFKRVGNISFVDLVAFTATRPSLSRWPTLTIVAFCTLAASGGSLAAAGTTGYGATQGSLLGYRGWNSTFYGGYNMTNHTPFGLLAIRVSPTKSEVLVAPSGAVNVAAESSVTSTPKSQRVGLQTIGGSFGNVAQFIAFDRLLTNAEVQSIYDDQKTRFT